MVYNNILALCKERGVSITRLSIEIGAGNSAPTKWKRGAVPRMDTLKKIADYFGVTVTFLISGVHPATSDLSGDISKSSGHTLSNSIDMTKQEIEFILAFRSLDLSGQSVVTNCLLEQVKKLGG